MFIELQSAYFVLRAWKKNPKLSKREIGVFGQWTDDNPENEKPLTEKEVEGFKKLMRENNPTTYHELFPDEKE